MYLFRYRATVEDAMNDYKDRKAVGLLFAKSYKAAAGCIEEYYGKELDSIDYLRSIADSRIIEINEASENFIQEIEDSWIW